jgi:ribosomal protein S18 acetylase RimI-like enzyme
MISTISSNLQTSSGTILIRPAQTSDSQAYRALRLECLRDNPTAFGSDYENNAKKPLPAWEEIITASTDDISGMLFFAVHKENLVGMAGIRRRIEPKIRHNATIFSVFVQPAWRGQHIAEALIEACITWGRSRGVRNVKLAVIANNSSAIRCYLRIGFQIYGVEPKVIFVNGKDYDELLMWRQV